MSGFAVDVAVERANGFRLSAAFETPGGISVVFGPSGAGKSTLLLALLGAVEPQRGRIVVAGRTLYDAERSLALPTRRRRVGMVFQDALLFPHLSALHNVTFALRGSERARRARELLERVGAAGLADLRPAELSGGQRQRVALARSLAAEPRALLLDEPFSALDAAARHDLGRLLLELQSESGVPFLHVTHDLAEALRLGDHLLLLDDGRIVQSGQPADVVARPASIAATRAVGTENVFTAKILRHRADRGCSEVDLGGTVVQTALLDDPAGATIQLGLRAEDVLLSLAPIHHTSARNVIPGTVATLAEVGPSIELRIDTPVSIRVMVTPASVHELSLEPGARVHLLIKATAFSLLT